MADIYHNRIIALAFVCFLCVSFLQIAETVSAQEVVATVKKAEDKKGIFALFCLVVTFQCLNYFPSEIISRLLA